MLISHRTKDNTIVAIQQEETVAHITEKRKLQLLKHICSMTDYADVMDGRGWASTRKTCKGMDWWHWEVKQQRSERYRREKTGLNRDGSWLLVATVQADHGNKEEEQEVDGEEKKVEWMLWHAWTKDDQHSCSSPLSTMTRQETQHKTSSTACLHLCSDGSSIRYSTVTLNCDFINLMHS